jgi:environmental stress-induced protein Ves
MRVVRPSDWVAMPWRNGVGVTHEIARDADPFTWRVSVAEIRARGPFSSFPGIDRWLGLLDGERISLSIASSTDRAPTAVTLDPASPPFPFRGEDSVHGTPLGGPTRDLNVMVARARWRASVRRVDVVDPAPVPLGGGFAIVFVLSGSARVGDVEVGVRDCVVGAEGSVLVARGPVAAWVVGLAARR